MRFRCILALIVLFTVACGCPAEPMYDRWAREPVGAGGEGADREEILAELRGHLTPAAVSCACGHTGMVAVKFVFLSDGTTREPEVVNDGVLPEDVAACIRTAIGELRIAPFQRPDEIPVTFPLRFD